MGLCESTGRVSAILLMTAALSIVPPMPMPMTVGGQGFMLAWRMMSMTAFFTPSTPSAGTSMSLSPGTIFV